MVKLILKSPYIKNTGNAGGYLKYIGTRENVELVPDARPPTKRQTQLINKLLQDFPDCKNSYEYSAYHDTPTKVNALHTPLREITSTGEFEQLFRLN